MGKDEVETTKNLKAPKVSVYSRREPSTHFGLAQAESGRAKSRWAVSYMTYTPSL